MKLPIPAVVVASALALASPSLLVPPAPRVDEEAFAFGLWGDMPYARNGDDPKMPALLADMNGDRQLAFTVFNGDLKDGSSPCTDDVYTTAVERFDQLRVPAVYVPGDNEWTDCHRTSNGGFDNLERLAHLRKVMFARPESFGRRRMSLEHQGPPGEPYSENTIWSRGPVVFVGLNLPGSNNNKVESEAACTEGSVRTLADCAADNAEYEVRDRANRDWLLAAFSRARSKRAEAVVVVVQANPVFDLPETAVDDRAQPGLGGYDNFVATLAGETRAFDGQVVLVHGDSHYFRIDKPMVAAAGLPSVPNFTRVETFGSPKVHWLTVSVSPKDPNVFRVEPRVVPGN